MQTTAGRKRHAAIALPIATLLALVGVGHSDVSQASAYTSVWWPNDYGMSQDWGCTSVNLEFSTSQDSRWGAPQCDVQGDTWVHEGMDFLLPTGTALYAGRHRTGPLFRVGLHPRRESRYFGAAAGRQHRHLLGTSEFCNGCHGASDGGHAARLQW